MSNSVTAFILRLLLLTNCSLLRVSIMLSHVFSNFWLNDIKVHVACWTFFWQALKSFENIFDPFEVIFKLFWRKDLAFIPGPTLAPLLRHIPFWFSAECPMCLAVCPSYQCQNEVTALSKLWKLFDLQLLSYTLACKF